MSRYIDADKELQELEDMNVSELGEQEKFGVRYAKLILSNSPTADVAEEKHGHWDCIKISENKWWNTCSVCKDTWQDDEGKITFAYCPTCGAKMEEKDD